MVEGELVLVCSTLIWAFQHALQAESRMWFIHRFGAKCYLSSRYALNLTWTGGNALAATMLYANSPQLWTGSTAASLTLLHFSLIVLIGVLIIPGAPVGTNAKIAHRRHNDELDGARTSRKSQVIGSRDRTPTLVHEADAQVSSLCKITNQPQLLAIV
eukprot:6045914-Prymnesium_polylepis.1